MFFRPKFLSLFTAALLYTSAANAAPKMDANGNEEITLEEYVAFEMATFNKQDTDFNGRVTAKETRDWRAEKNRRYMKTAFKKLDPNGDGRLTEDEYGEVFMSEMEKQFSLNQQSKEKQFDEMDDDKNGHISRLEYHSYLGQNLNETLAMMRDSFREQFKMMDKDKDGLVTENEYANILDAYSADIYGDDALGANETVVDFEAHKPVALDNNGDGIITRAEQREYSRYQFSRLDTNNDNIITKKDSPYLFSDKDATAVELESQIIFR